MKHWYDTVIMPPDDMVEVLCETGEIAHAYPCIYPFRVERVGIRKYDVIIKTCEPYQEGWMICLDIADLGFTPKGSVIAWRPIFNPNLNNQNSKI